MHARVHVHVHVHGHMHLWTGKLEDQQLGTMWKYLEARCADAGIAVQKPSRYMHACTCTDACMHCR